MAMGIRRKPSSMFVLTYRVEEEGQTEAVPAFLRYTEEGVINTIKSKVREYYRQNYKTNSASFLKCALEEVDSQIAEQRAKYKGVRNPRYLVCLCEVDNNLVFEWRKETPK